MWKPRAEHTQREPCFNSIVFMSSPQIMKCNSVLKHNFEGYSEKCNPLQGRFIDLIISLFYGNGDIVDFAYKFINSITFQ